MSSTDAEFSNDAAAEPKFLGHASEFLADADESPLVQLGAGLLLLALAIAAFANSLHVEFLWNDSTRLSEDLQLRSAVGLRYAWRHPLTGPGLPIGETLLGLQYGYAGTNHPAVYHAISILLHIAVTLLFWRLLLALRLAWAAFAAALYAVHPTVIAAAVLVSNQPLLLCLALGLLFSLISLRLSGLDPVDTEEVAPTYFRLPTRRWILALTALTLLLPAMAAHEIAFVFPAAMILRLLWSSADHPASRRIVISLVIATLGGLAIAIAHSLFRPDAATDFLGAALLEVPSTMLLAIWRMLMAPAAFFDPLIDHRLLHTSIAAAVLIALVASIFVHHWLARYARWLTLLLLLATIASALTAVGGAENERVVAAGDLLLPVMISLVAMVQIVYFARHRLDPPPGNPASELPGPRRFINPIAATLLTGGILALTVWRSAAYADEPHLFAAASAARPQSLLLGLAHGQAILRAPPAAIDDSLATNIPPPDPSIAALPVFQAVLDRHPASPLALTGLAGVYAKQKRFDEAIDLYRTAITNDPANATLFDGESQLYASKGVGPQAIRLSQRAIELNPRDAIAHHDLALQLDIAGRLDEAAILYGKAMQLDPLFCPPRVNLATLWFRQGKIAEASEMLLTATQIDPMNFDAYANAGAMLATLQQWPRAEQMLRAALSIRSDAEGVWKNLAIVLEKEGKAKESAFARDRAARMSQ